MRTRESIEYDALLLLSFGGPEGPGEVMPFLENVTRGRDVPRDRLLEVAEHYHHFGGVSPINAQNRALIEELRVELAGRGIELPIYFGNRNWHPMLGETVRQMRRDGVRHVLAFVTSAFSSYSGCRQYREDIVAACAVVPGAPAIDKLRLYYNHPGFVLANAEHLRAALDHFPPEARSSVPVLFTAHSVPVAMAASSHYVSQLEEAASLVASAAGVARYELAYQSRSGPARVPWLEPDILDRMRELAEAGARRLVVLPLGFVSDHMEVKFDLDVEAAELALELEIDMVRAASAGTHPAFVAMIGELVAERLDERIERRALGERGACADICPPDCCLPPPMRPSPARPG